MKKEWKIRWRKYYVCDKSQFLQSIEIWYFDRKNIILSRNYVN